MAKRNALLFAIFDCGFVPRCALEVDDSSEVRFEKILRIIDDCRFGIHDISRIELDPNTKTPRFNMPLELGVFLGAKRFGEGRQKNKRCLILDKERYRYQPFISDIAGHDIQSHHDEPEKLITIVRNWLNAATSRKTIPGGTTIVNRWRQFNKDLPAMCAAIPISPDELTYNDYANFISTWLKEVG
jgi:hypothetical protein